MYYTLLTKHDGKWYPQFGDHEKCMVVYERQEIIRSYGLAEKTPASDTKIIATKTAHQWRINRAIAELNQC